jgi:hypothetical protein
LWEVTITDSQGFAIVMTLWKKYNSHPDARFSHAQGTSCVDKQITFISTGLISPSLRSNEHRIDRSIAAVQAF